MKAFIFAAGKGTRLQPFTLYHPKALVMVNGVALLERNITYLQSYGFNDFVINVHHFATQIIDFLNQKDNFGATIHISDESDELLETGGGLVFAEHLIQNGEDFLAMNADILTNLNLQKMIDEHKTLRNFVTLAVSDRESSRKLLFDDEMRLKGWVNKQTGEQKLAEYNTRFKELAFSGIHIINPGIFRKFKRKGKFSIMEEYLDLMFTEKIIGFQHQSILIDVGRPESVLEAEKHFK